jgi:hypothetical protein
VGATVSLNFPALLFTGSVSAVAVLFFGAIPAWMAARTDVYLGLRSNGQILTKNSQRWSRALVAGLDHQQHSPIYRDSSSRL